MELEASLMEAAGSAGVPVPRVLRASDDPSALGSAYVLMERMEGETLPRRLLTEAELAPARAGLAEECGRILARLHSLPADAVPGLPGADPLDQYQAALDGLRPGLPTFEVALDWLRRNRPEPVPQTIVHGDFRNGNLMVGPEGVRAVLDWELAHRGDPREDLGWLCVRSWRFGVDLPVGGFGRYEDLLQGYGAEGGAPVDLDALRWWEVFGNLRWGVICLMQASAHLSGAIRSVELAAIGRRVCEVEWDLLSLLPGMTPTLTAPAELTPAARPTAGLFGRPEAAELLLAVEEYLDSDVVTATGGRVGFHARVASRVLAVVRRELEMGPALVEQHRRGLDELQVVDDAELADAIRSGRVATDNQRLVRFLGHSVGARLAVANPRYRQSRPPVDLEGRGK
jgi:aminoglycoside phosphotransferase (APT) family kinase protein